MQVSTVQVAIVADYCMYTSMAAEWSSSQSLPKAVVLYPSLFLRQSHRVVTNGSLGQPSEMRIEGGASRNTESIDPSELLRQGRSFRRQEGKLRFSYQIPTLLTNPDDWSLSGNSEWFPEIKTARYLVYFSYDIEVLVGCDGIHRQLDPEIFRVICGFRRLDYIAVLVNICLPDKCTAQSDVSRISYLSHFSSYNFCFVVIDFSFLFLFQ